MQDRRIHLVLTFSLVITAVIAAASCRGDLGDANNPVSIYVVHSQESQKSRAAAEKLRAYVAKATGLEVRLKVPECYFDLVVALGEEDADLLFMNDVSYLLAHKKYGAQAVMAVQRGGLETSYHAAIVARADSGIKAVADLKGKKVAYVDLHSMSGYVVPAVHLRDKGVVPGEMLEAGTHDAVVRWVYDKKADAGFIYFNKPSADGVAHDARTLIAKEHPDVLEAVVVVELTEPIPNEPIVVGKHVPGQVREKLMAALTSLQESADGKAILMDLNDISGLRLVSDTDYDGMRKALHGLGKSPEEVVPGGKLLDVTHKTRIHPMPPAGD